MSEIKKSAKHGNFVIQQAENDSISIICDNTKQALRDIANEIGMEFDSDWNTQYFGHRLINFINGVDTTRKSKEVEQSNNNTDGVSDEDWEWWISLPDVLKYTVLYSFKDVFEEEGVPFPEWDSDYDSFADTEFKFTERSTDDVNNAGYWLLVWITGGYEEGEFVGPDSEFKITVPRDAWGLDSVEKLAHLKFMVTLDLGQFDTSSLPAGIDKLTQLKMLNLCDNVFGDPAREVVQLFPLKNLESLWIRNTGIEYNKDLFSQLQEALPDCEIEPHSRPFYY